MPKKTLPIKNSESVVPPVQMTLDGSKMFWVEGLGFPVNFWLTADMTEFIIDC